MNDDERIRHESANQSVKAEEQPDNPSRRDALEKLVKYTPPAMVTLLAQDSAWAQISGGPPPPPSDRRLKAQVSDLGVSVKGLPLYSYVYRNDASGTRYVGVMAQEVKGVYPDAVARRPDGYYGVYYDRLGLKMVTYAAWQQQGLEAVRESETHRH